MPTAWGVGVKKRLGRSVEVHTKERVALGVVLSAVGADERAKVEILHCLTAVSNVRTPREKWHPRVAAPTLLLKVVHEFAPALLGLWVLQLVLAQLLELVVVGELGKVLLKAREDLVVKPAAAQSAPVHGRRIAGVLCHSRQLAGLDVGDELKVLLCELHACSQQLVVSSRPRLRRLAKTRAGTHRRQRTAAQSRPHLAWSARSVMMTHERRAPLTPFQHQSRRG